MKKLYCVSGVVGAVASYLVIVAATGLSTTRGEPAAATAPPPEQSSLGPRPKAVAVDPVFDFGVCDPSADGEHTFLVRNDGDAPLEVRKGSTTCKCTLADLPQNYIPPGGIGQVRVVWTAITYKVLFNQRATIMTNDPDQPGLSFNIKGEVRTLLGAAPSQIVFSSLHPGETQTRSVTLYSQEWEEFEVLRIENSNPKFTWSLRPASADALREVKAKSGYELEVTSPEEQPMGHFTERLHVYVAPKGQSDKERKYELLVTGNRVNWLSVSGEGVQGKQGMSLGSVPSGKGAKRRVTVLLRDAKRKLKIERIEAAPNFVRAALTAARPDGSWCNLYHLDIEIPRDAPICSYLAIEKGELRFYSDDPKLPVVTMPVAFAVVREELARP
jgi:hypothetical protein